MGNLHGDQCGLYLADCIPVFCQAAVYEVRGTINIGTLSVNTQCVYPTQRPRISHTISQNCSLLGTAF